MTTRLNPSGFVVIEAAEEFEQVLSLDLGKDKPAGGILTWANDRSVHGVRVFFPTRRLARAAIERTEHYRKAFGRTDLPEKASCRIEFIALVEERADA